MPQVKRSYDASARRARAEQTHEAVVVAAREQFLGGGFTATKVSAVAGAGGVSVEYVYKRFGGKAGLLRAVVARALQGTGPEPAETRADALATTDPDALVRGWGRLAAEVAPLVAPVLLLVRSAAEQDSQVRSLADELDTSRRERMAANARRLADAGLLRAGLGLEQATDVMWALSSPEVYDLLVLRRGWSSDQYGDFVARGISGELLG